MRIALLLCACALFGGCFVSPAWRARHRELKAERRAEAEALHEFCLTNPYECEQLRIARAQGKHYRQAAVIGAVGAAASSRPARAPAQTTTRCQSYGDTTECRSY